MYEYNEGLRPAGRNPRLYLAKGSEVRKFTGENIPGFSAVASSRYEKRGKWSNTTFQLDLAPGVRLDKLEQFALATETEGAATEVVVISFGSPTNRAIREGYWKKSKSSQSSDGRRVTVEPGMGEYGAEWGKPVVVEPERAKVLSSRHTPGMHNGYWTIEVAVPIAQKESK